MKTVLSSLVLTLSLSFLIAQNNLLQSGPMLGYSDYREVLLWVQTTQAAEVHYEYWAKGSTQKQTTPKVTTNASNAFIAKVLAQNLTYGTTYEYALFINDKKVELNRTLEFQSQVNWPYRQDPPEINFATGSCAYINEEQDDRKGKPYGGGYEIFETIHQQNPDFMVWLGDNTYYRVPDWTTRTGMLHRNTHTRSLPELQNLLSSTHNYAIWDDHDYGPNDSDRGFAMKTTSQEVFELFWGNQNSNVTGEGGITNMFVWGDCAFYMLDNRFHRSPNKRTTGEREYLGDTQIEWLIDNLKHSQAPFKFVAIGGQTINSAAIYENYATYAEERQKLLDLIAAEKIEGVIFLSGDRHHSELSAMPREGAYDLLDFTVSPLTSGTHANKDEGNIYQVKNSLIVERNFALFNVSGTFRDRTLTVTYMNAQGEKLYEHKLHENSLKYPKVNTNE